jgi:surface antigen
MRRAALSGHTFLSRGWLSLLVLMVCGPVLADPPDHAKAHGWRKKHDPYYVGYTGREWPHDFGIVEGHCNRDEIGTVLGAVVGGAIGSQVGEGSQRTVAIVVGSVLGAVIGREIGKDLDERDRACVGHSLELVKSGQSVRWVNEATHVTYLLTPKAPAKSQPSNCRTYDLKATLDGKSRVTAGRACRDGEGTWTIQP